MRVSSREKSLSHKSEGAQSKHYFLRPNGRTTTTTTTTIYFIDQAMMPLLCLEMWWREREKRELGRDSPRPMASGSSKIRSSSPQNVHVVFARLPFNWRSTSSPKNEWSQFSASRMGNAKNRSKQRQQRHLPPPSFFYHGNLTRQSSSLQLNNLTCILTQWCCNDPCCSAIQLDRKCSLTIIIAPA